MSEQRIIGEWFNPGESRAYPATIIKHARGFRVVRGDTVHAFCGLGELVSRNDIGDARRSFVFPNGGLFVVNSNEGVNEWLGEYDSASFFTKLSKKEHSWLVALAALMLIPAIIFAVFRWGIPAAADPLARLVPQHYIEELDQYSLELVDEYYFSSSRIDYSLQREIENAFDTIRVYVHEISPNTELNLNFRDGGEIGANALALPAGTIILTDQMIDAGLTISEITMVLAHEAGHIAERHSVEGLISSASVTLTLTFLFGDASFALETLAVGSGAILQSLAYTRNAEREADRFSANLAPKLGISAGCLATALEKIESYQTAQYAEQEPHLDDADHPEESHAISQWLVSHPSTEERTATVGQACNDT